MSKEEKDQGDLIKSPADRADFVVEDRIRHFIELLDNHGEKNLGSYQRFLLRELQWIEREKGMRKSIAIMEI